MRAKVGSKIPSFKLYFIETQQIGRITLEIANQSATGMISMLSNYGGGFKGQL